MNEKLARFYSGVTDEQMSDLQEHLQKRVDKQQNKVKKLSVVFDMLHDCNLRCKGCGTDADITIRQVIENPNPSFDNVMRILEKLKTYADTQDKKVFLNIGGGEPFLRSDIHEILRCASEFFGAGEVAIDTNASLDNHSERIKKGLPYLANVGISVNGLEQSHNKWSGNSRINSFQRATGVITDICGNPLDSEKIEVTSVPTKQNLKEIPELMKRLADSGVKNYSVHRAMPVGRMKNHADIIPSAQEYLQLLIDVVTTAKETGLNAHIHHSIESIHAALLLGLNTYADKTGNPDLRSSIGIEPDGKLVFDPWCTTGIWKDLPSGNLITDRDLDLTEQLNTGASTIFNLAKRATSQEVRCDGCDVSCSGGSRVIAATNKLAKIKGKTTTSSILDAMTAVDPACPLYTEDGIAK